LLSRGADSTLKLWDLRKFKSPIASIDNLEVGFSNAGCCFSPGDDFVLTGVGATKGGDGYLSIFNATDLSLVKRLGAPGNVVPVTWHPKLNQIFYGCGDRKHGAARILYDTDLSTSGALLAVGRRPRTSNLSDYTVRELSCIFIPVSYCIILYLYLSCRQISSQRFIIQMHSHYSRLTGKPKRDTTLMPHQEIQNSLNQIQGKRM
jgi:WD40 repeat protein